MTTLIQIIIFVSEVLAMWLTQQNNESLKKYAPIVGLIGEPCWLYSTYQTAQWGIFALSVVFMFIWAQGLYNHYKKGDYSS